MRRTKLTKFIRIPLAAAVALIAFASFAPTANVEQLSLDLTFRSLFQGKSVTGNGALYYRVSGGKMVTRMTHPTEQLVITNALGEYKNYDIKSNSVMLSQGAQFSSKVSFIYSFLSGETNDMGLERLGYSLSDTRFEDGMAIKEFVAAENMATKARKVEVVYDNFLPIFVGFYTGKGEILQKVFYTNYQQVSFIQMPFTVTEIEYVTETDSTITQRKYSNLKVNNQIDDQWLNFTIPTDAQVVGAELPTPGTE